MEVLRMLSIGVILIIQGSTGLRNAHMLVPEAVARGSKVVMKCLYELEQEMLYQVKWYRGDREFCRFAPRDVPPLKVFKLQGIDVVGSETNAQTLTIAEATQTANGKFTCEVSADSPSFQTAQMHAFMYVVDLPKEHPEIYGLKRSYRVGSKLKAECVLRDTMPPANLTYFINGERVSSQHVWHRVEVGNNDLLTAYSTIQFVVQKHHVVDDEKLRLKCLAVIYTAYHFSIEKSVSVSAEKTTTTEEPMVHRPRRPAPTTTRRLKLISK